MLLLQNTIKLTRCPHCNVADPLIQAQQSLATADGNKGYPRRWFFYVCSRCGGVITAWAENPDQPIQQMFPDARTIDETIPERAKSYLEQAIQSLHAPAGALMLTASAVDAMLKYRGYKEGSLYTRIEKAVEDHILTPEMAQWAHDIRLDANDQRHVDEDAPLPTAQDAQKCIEFATTLGHILFVLPARVKRGIESAKKEAK